MLFLMAFIHLQHLLHRPCSLQQLISCSAEMQQSSSAGAAVSIKPPPKAAAKGPAKQVSDKKAAEYAKLEDQLFEL
jgi:hypothetical protein